MTTSILTPVAKGTFVAGALAGAVVVGGRLSEVVARGLDEGKIATVGAADGVEWFEVPNADATMASKGFKSLKLTRRAWQRVAPRRSPACLRVVERVWTAIPRFWRSAMATLDNYASLN